MHLERSQNRLVRCGPFRGDGLPSPGLDLTKDKRVALADGVFLPFQDGEFDKVLCTGVLMHITDTDLAVRELVRVLRHGGRMVCSINNSLSPYSFPVRIWNRRKKEFCAKISLSLVVPQITP